MMASELVLAAQKALLSGLNCAQSVFGAFAERFDYAPEEFYRIAAGFGGGMYRGDTCGAVTGAVMVLGAAYGDDRKTVSEKVKAFQEAFTARFGTTICRGLLGYDFSVPGAHEEAVAAGVMREKCPGYVVGAVEILEELLEQ